MAATRTLFLLLFTCLATAVLVSGFIANRCVLTPPLECKDYAIETTAKTNTLRLQFRSQDAGINLSDVRIDIQGCRITEQSAGENASMWRVYDCPSLNGIFTHRDFFDPFSFICAEGDCYTHKFEAEMFVYSGQTQIGNGEIRIYNATPPADAYWLSLRAALIILFKYILAPVLLCVFLMGLVGLSMKKLQKLPRKSVGSSTMRIAATILSALAPGAGQLLKGEPVKAIMFSGLMLFSVVLINFYAGLPLLTSFWIWSILDAFRTVETGA